MFDNVGNVGIVMITTATRGGVWSAMPLAADVLIILVIITSRVIITILLSYYCSVHGTSYYNVIIILQGIQTLAISQCANHREVSKIN